MSSLHINRFGYEYIMSHEITKSFIDIQKTTQKIKRKRIEFIYRMGNYAIKLDIRMV